MLSLKQRQAIQAMGAQLRVICPNKFAKLNLETSPQDCAAMFPKLRAKLTLILRKGKLFRFSKEVTFLLLCSEVPTCNKCGESTTFLSTTRSYRTYCSLKCAYASEARADNIRQKRLAFTPEKKANIKNQYKETSQENWGTDHPWESKEVREKINTTNANKTDDEKTAIQEQFQATNRQRRGYTHQMKDPAIAKQTSRTKQNKTDDEKAAIVTQWKATNLKRTGYEIPMQNPATRSQFIKTSMKNWGCPSPVQHPEVFAKIVKSRNAYKEIIINGRVHRCQGNEPIVLKDLESRILKMNTTPRKVPPIWYTKLNGNKGRYFADALLKTRKTSRVVLEVKCLYTLIDDWQVNVRKFKAAMKWCAENSAIFILAIADKGKIEYLRNPTVSEIKKAYYEF